MTFYLYSTSRLSRRPSTRSITQIILHGTAWRPAATYAQYSDGWAYDAAEQLLYVKLTGRSDTEAILVTF